MIERSPLACDLTGLDDEEQQRRKKLMDQLRPAILEIGELSDGLAIFFDAGTSLVQIAKLIALESQCCPFLSFGLLVPETHGPIRLEITGRDGVKEFLIAELRLPGFPVE
jgi:hypothetical protein